MSGARSLPLRSCAYQCRVLHARLAPVRHRFVYRLFFLALDLDEWSTLAPRLRLLSTTGRNVYSLRADDYLPLAEPRHGELAAVPSPAGATLKQRALHLLAEHGLHPGPNARVVLVTLPRIFGYAFNPVSFYFCTTRDGTPVGAIAEVTNTFRELKPYVLQPNAPTTTDAASVRFVRRVQKDFYVSPYSPVDREFAFRLRLPGETLALQIDVHEPTHRTVTTTLVGHARPLNDRTLAWFLVLYPLLTLRVIVGIHWQALRLYLKRAPWSRKAAQAAQQTGLYRPHPSLSASTR